MSDGRADRLLPAREHYRELAGEIRRVAQLARFPFARKELLRLAASFEYRARLLADTRARDAARPIRVGTPGPLT
jgi:hypothetical protein